MANPFINPDNFDYFLLGGRKSPGLAKISGAAKVSKYQVNKPKGSTGASLTYDGRDLTKFKASIKLITADEYSQWQDFSALLKKEPNSKDPKAIEFYHPFITDELGVSAVVVEQFTQPEESGANEITVNIDFLEYAPPKASTSNISGSNKARPKGGANAATPTVDPNADKKAELAAAKAASDAQDKAAATALVNK